MGDFAEDGVMAFFNGPSPVPDAAEPRHPNGPGAATSLRVVRRSWRHRGYDLEVGFGIASGFATLGLLGPAPRIDYNPVGTVVKLAAVSAAARAARRPAARGGGRRSRFARCRPSAITCSLGLVRLELPSA